MFFESERQHFFRPLNGKRRELVASCLRSLHERLHGPAADYSQSLTRDGLRDLLLPILQAVDREVPDVDLEGDELGQIPFGDDAALVGAIIRSLLRHGWLETFPDRTGLVTAYRLTRGGKLFAEALWAHERPHVRARQRNMRSCRNSVEAALRNFDAYDLADAYEHAERVISDLAEGVDYFQDLVRRLMAEASRTPWDEFMGFLDRFEREFKKQLTADDANRHRHIIRDTLNRLRNLERTRHNYLECQLNDVAPWILKERTGDSSLDWLLNRIEDMVELACSTMQPELIRAMNQYMRRAANIVQQALMLRGGATRPAYKIALTRAAALAPGEQDTYLQRIGTALAACEVRLLDPSSFRLRTRAQRRKALTVTALPKITREARLAAALARAETSAFALSNEDVHTMLLRTRRLLDRDFRISTLPVNTAVEVLAAMQAVESIRASDSQSLKATRLDSRFVNPYYTGFDFLIQLQNHADRPDR
jgi:hypothetical protein